MNKSIQNIVDAMENKPKGKKYVDPEEYEKLTGKKADMEEDEELDDTEEDEEMEPPKSGRVLSLFISVGKKK